MVVGEYRVFVFDYVSCTLKELDLALFDGKAPTSIETFSHENFVAFGGADGSIRLFDLITWKMEKKLTGGHNKPIVKMYSHWEDGQSFLCSASEDGLFCKWIFTGPGAVNLDSRSETKGGLQVNDVSVDPVELQLIVATEKYVH
jgi:WD40 repeat protein